MPASGRIGGSVAPHSIATTASLPSFTLFTRYVPASSGVQGRRLTSQRGVTPPQIGGVFVVLASWRAPWGPSALGLLMDARTLIFRRASWQWGLTAFVRDSG